MIKYFDIFAGIGGFRSGLEKAGGFECVGYCEIDRYAKKAYETMYDTTKTFKNELKKGSIKINKQSEDGENGGREFEISGNGKTYTIKTGSDGIAILSDIPVYDSNNEKITYTISEKNVPVKYVVPADQTATLTADATTTKTFKNILKKFTVEVTKQDAKTFSAQGDGTLSGAVYGIYRDGALVDSYTTDENGYFKTKEYVCGNYMLQEISPSEGYLLNETVYPVGAEPKNYTVESNLISMTVTEDVVKGNIAIIKHSDDGTTQIETPEVGAEFEVYLKSAGSYANAKIYLKGEIVLQDLDKAEKYLLLAEDNEFTPYALGKLYLQEEKYDILKAVDYFEKSADKNMWSSYQLGRLYLFGAEGLEKDKENAAQWLTKSANDGNEYAQNMLQHIEEFENAMLANMIFGLFVNLSRCIEDDYTQKYKSVRQTVDSRLRRIIHRKKQSLGIKDDQEQQFNY